MVESVPTLGPGLPAPWEVAVTEETEELVIRSSGLEATGERRPRSPEDRCMRCPAGRLRLLPFAHEEIIALNLNQERPLSIRVALPAGGSVGSEPFSQFTNPTQ